VLLNLTVVYFAFGAPVGVYGVIRSEGTSSRHLASNILQFLLWPLFAALSVRNAFALHPPAISIEDKIDALRAECEAEIDRRSVGEFRDAFVRYTGLTIAPAAGQTAANDLLKAAGRQSTRAAAACIARRNTRRLEFQRLLARNELLAVLLKHSSTRIRDLTSRLAELLDDADLR
jgi:hypothetical protein